MQFRFLRLDAYIFVSKYIAKGFEQLKYRSITTEGLYILIHFFISEFTPETL